jgi:DNA gyrase subunit A
MRIVIELRRGVTPKVVLNQLFSNTQLQVNFGINNLALVDGKPKLLNLKEAVGAFVNHRKEVVTRRTQYDLRRAEERAHILEGLKKALDNIDEVIEIIKASETVDAARTNLIGRFSFSEAQAQEILNMRLQKLTSLETQKIIDELNEVLALIEHLKDLLSSEQKILGVVREETEEIAATYGDERRTEIVADEIEEINVEDLIQKEDMVVLISNRGYIKRVPVSSYRRQGRGGKGSASAVLRDGDFIESIFIASTHDYILFISSEGKAYWLKVHEIPEASRQARGTHVKSILAISADEEIASVVSLSDFASDQYIFMATCRGVVKRVRTGDFSNARTRGIVAIRLDAGDKLVTALLTSGERDVVLLTRKGHALRCSEETVRAMGRASRGVTGVRLAKDDELAAVIRVEPEEQMLVISENGFGKRVEYENFTPHGRGTRGQIAYRITERTGELVEAVPVQSEDDVMCITSQGNTIKLRAKDVPVLGKQAMGVRIVNIEKPDFVVGIARAAKED